VVIVVSEVKKPRRIFFFFFGGAESKRNPRQKSTLQEKEKNTIGSLRENLFSEQILQGLKLTHTSPLEVGEKLNFGLQ
jgi:hypothetical protein